MFTRHVTMKLKANSSAELTRIIEKELIPLLRRQEGFRHEDTSITPELSEAVVNSYWDTKEYAAAYDRTGYPELLRALSNVVEGTPRVETFEISSSTFHKITAKRREAYRTANLVRG